VRKNQKQVKRYFLRAPLKNHLSKFGGLLFRLFFEELRLHIFTLKFVKYDSIILILRKKSTKNTPKQAKRSA